MGNSRLRPILYGTVVSTPIGCEIRIRAAFSTLNRMLCAVVTSAFAGGVLRLWQGNGAEREVLVPLGACFLLWAGIVLCTALTTRKEGAIELERLWNGVRN